MIPKPKQLRDSAYIAYLKTQPCLLTGRHATGSDAIDPMHIGTAGKGLKIGDDCAIPVLHSLHLLGHQKGEASVLRAWAPVWLIRDAFRAYAREMYREWKDGR